MMQELKTTQLLESLKSDNAELRRAAWLGAAEAGPEALGPLANLMVTGELEVSRAAERAMWRLVRDLGSPEAEPASRRKLVTGLRELVSGPLPGSVRRQATWMFSEIADAADAESIAFLLRDEELREDARCALERIPGRQSLEVLWTALEEAPEEFKMNIVQSLRARGETVAGYPCRKLTPKA